MTDTSTAPDQDPLKPVRLYQMSESDYNFIRQECGHDPNYVPGMDPEKDALMLAKVTAAWTILGIKMGFDPGTARPASGWGSDYFLATPMEQEKCPQCKNIPGIVPCSTCNPKPDGSYSSTNRNIHSYDDVKKDTPTQ